MSIPVVSETAFQGQVEQLASLLGWHHMHVFPLQDRSGEHKTPTTYPGWPDLVLWHPQKRRFIAAELKTDKGRPSREQIDCLRALYAAGVPAYIWRPRDLGPIQQILRDEPVAPAAMELLIVNLRPGTT